MRHLYKFACVVFSATLLLTGCKGKDGDPGPAGATGATGPAGPAGPSGQNLTGTISGYVNPVDENGAVLAKNGVTVTIDGLTPAVTTTTNTDGKFEFLNVRNGTYNLSFSRAGLATFRRFGLPHVGGDQPTYLGTTTITQVSTSTVTALNATTSATNGTVTLNLTFANPVPMGTYRAAIFAGTGASVNQTTGMLLFTFTSSPAFPTTSYSTTITVGRATFTNAGFAAGTTVYLAAFGSTASLFSYSDPATGRFVYPALNATSSPVVSVVVP